MNEIEFRQQLDAFAADMREEALRLYASGIDPARVLTLAISIASARLQSKAEGDARARRVLTPHIGARN